VVYRRHGTEEEDAWRDHLLSIPRCKPRATPAEGATSEDVVPAARHQAQVLLVSRFPVVHNELRRIRQPNDLARKFGVVREDMEDGIGDDRRDALGRSGVVVG
jgi:hypothetical protein